MRILVMALPSSPFENEYKIHYSIFKSFGAAIGFNNLNHKVYYMSSEMETIIDNIQLLPHSKMDKDFIYSLDLVIFTHENGVEKCIKGSAGLDFLIKERLAGKKAGPKLIIKMGKHDWMAKTEIGIKNYYKAFDYFFCQEKGFMQEFRSSIKDIDNKIFYSEMGVPLNILGKEKKSPFKKSKYNLIYMGRLRQSPSRFPFITEMMDNLGADFSLNILPGTFSKPAELLDRLNEKGQNKFGPQSKENFEWLENYFSKSKNIKIHNPVEWGSHWNYLHHSDLGLDFSPHLKKQPYPAGNAKLLEYLAVGLPVITEIGAGNSNLVNESSGGIIVSENNNIDLYCKAIKNALSMKFDREKISKITIKNNNWNVRANDMLNKMGYK